MIWGRVLPQGTCFARLDNTQRDVTLPVNSEWRCEQPRRRLERRALALTIQTHARAQTRRGARISVRQEVAAGGQGLVEAVRCRGRPTGSCLGAAICTVYCRCCLSRRLSLPFPFPFPLFLPFSLPLPPSLSPYPPSLPPCLPPCPLPPSPFSCLPSYLSHPLPASLPPSLPLSLPPSPPPSLRPSVPRLFRSPPPSVPLSLPPFLPSLPPSSLPPPLCAFSLKKKFARARVQVHALSARALTHTSARNAQHRTGPAFKRAPRSLRSASRAQAVRPARQCVTLLLGWYFPARDADFSWSLCPLRRRTWSRRSNGRPCAAVASHGTHPVLRVYQDLPIDGNDGCLTHRLSLVQRDGLPTPVGHRRPPAREQAAHRYELCAAAARQLHGRGHRRPHIPAPELIAPARPRPGGPCGRCSPKMWG